MSGYVRGMPERDDVDQVREEILEHTDPGDPTFQALGGDRREFHESGTIHPEQDDQAIAPPG